MKIIKFIKSLFATKQKQTVKVTLQKPTKWTNVKKELRFEKSIESLSTEAKRIMRKYNKISNRTLNKLAK